MKPSSLPFPPPPTSTPPPPSLPLLFNINPPSSTATSPLQQPLSLSTAQQPPPSSNNRKPFPHLTVTDKWRFRDSVINDYPSQVEFDVSSFVTLIQGFGAANSVLEGLKVHSILIKNGYYDGSLDIKACLVEMYCKCGEIELARCVFDESSERDFALWVAMLAGFARRGLRWEALQCVRLMVEEGIRPNNSVLTKFVLPVIGEIRARRIGQEVHGYLVKKKLSCENAWIRTTLVDMYCKCGDVVSGRRVLSSSMERNFMVAYASSGRLQKAIKSMVRMQRDGFRPNVVTVASILPVCAHSRALKQGKEIHGYALKHSFLPHVSIISSLMVLYSKCGVIEYSRKLFDGMERRNVISWTAMIDSYVENSCIREALGVIRSMQLTEHRPDTVTVARMLSVCSKLKLVKLGKEIHGQVLKRDFVSAHYVSAELIDMYGSCGDVDKAKLVFRAVTVKGSMTWTALIRAYVYKEWYRDAIDLLNRMISSGCAPNCFTIEAVLSICDKAGLVEDAFRIFDLLSRYKIEASKEHCVIMIRLLTRYGKLDEAQRFVEMSSSL